YYSTPNPRAGGPRGMASGMYYLQRRAYPDPIPQRGGKRHGRQLLDANTPAVDAVQVMEPGRISSHGACWLTSLPRSSSLSRAFSSKPDKTNSIIRKPADGPGLDPTVLASIYELDLVRMFDPDSLVYI